MPIRRMGPEECISCVEGNRTAFLAANALAVCALEQSVTLNESGSNAVELAPDTARVLKGVSSELLPMDQEYAHDLSQAATVLSSEPIDPWVLFCASRQQYDALQNGKDHRVELY